ncbi:SRPBCC domain-containing protein [Sphingomonas sp. MMS12-HWE2-04]|uniref:SRPBCC domain-containing protein n=1 Tax=Sphingomonas sp. MMS12-HWE2-04 TaxID=3234199 RepID=UPI00384EDA58
MNDPAVTHTTFVLERSFKVTPAIVFAALSDPAIKRGWYAENDTHEVIQFDSDCRPGGADNLHYRFGEGTPFPGLVLANDGTYQDVIPDTRIVTTSTMSLDGRPISVSLTTFEILPTELGTDLICTNQVAFFAGSDGPVMREEGWRIQLDKLRKAVESQA